MKTFISIVWCRDSLTYNSGSGVLEIWNSSYHDSSKWLLSRPDRKYLWRNGKHLSKGTYSEAFIRVPTGNPSKILLLDILMNPWSTVTLGVQRNSVLPLPPEQLKIWGPLDLQGWQKCKAELQESFWHLVSVVTPALDFSIRDPHHYPVRNL